MPSLGDHISVFLIILGPQISVLGPGSRSHLFLHVLRSKISSLMKSFYFLPFITCFRINNCFAVPLGFYGIFIVRNLFLHVHFIIYKPVHCGMIIFYRQKDLIGFNSTEYKILCDNNTSYHLYTIII